MKKILFVATVTQHFYYFHIPYLLMFKELGWQVDVASHGDIELPCDNRYEIPFRRSPLDKENIKAYNMLKEIINNNHYDIIHCHTPVGGILARLAGRKQRKNGAKVIYTAHGFHFFKGAPKINWIIYYPIEYIMSKMTDCLITINDEDYNFAKKHLKAKQIVKVNGVGYNTDKYFPVDEQKKMGIRKEKGYSDKDKLLIYVAEMNANKNQGMLIKALAEILKTRNDVRLLIVGADNFSGKYVSLAKELGVDTNVDFLGHRDDVDDLLHMSDIAVGSSLREGLPVNVMEALACGLPIVLSDNRGHRSLVKDNENGFIVEPNDSEKMSEYIVKILDDETIYNRLSLNAVEMVKPFSKTYVMKEMTELYKQFV